MSPFDRTLVFAALTFGLAAAAQGQAAPQVEAPNPCPRPTPGKSYSNLPYVANDCWTTEYGPARADVVIVKGEGSPLHSTNMLRCNAGPYALCFYSGPPDKSGLPEAPHNKALPCTVNSDGKSASCTCQYYDSGVNYVDINGILNQNAWYQAIEECGHDGALCANLRDCATDADMGKKVCQREAKVCQYVRSQSESPSNQGGLVPGADTISTFGFAMIDRYGKDQTDCKNGVYAGCMTAACQFPASGKPADGGTVTCNCPLAAGPFQIGQGNGATCEIPAQGSTRYVWSASRTVDLDLHIVKE